MSLDILKERFNGKLTTIKYEQEIDYREKTIKNLEEEISTKLYRIFYFHHSYAKLERQEKFDKYDLGMDLIRDEQKKLALEIGNLQKEIDVNPFDKSVAIMRKNSDKEMLSKKYDKLFKKKED